MCTQIHVKQIPAILPDTVVNLWRLRFHNECSVYTINRYL